MTDPFTVLGISPDSDDEAVRRRYLELVRQHPPEQNPERFAAVRAAYEAVRDLHRRVRYRLFEQGAGESVEQIIEELACRTPRPRISLAKLLAAERPR